MKNIILTSINTDELIELFSVVVEDILTKNRKIEEQKVVINDSYGDYLTIDEVMEVCKIKSKSTLWNWRQNGKIIPKRWSGRKPLFLRQDIEIFLNRYTTEF